MSPSRIYTGDQALSVMLHTRRRVGLVPWPTSVSSPRPRFPLVHTMKHRLPISLRQSNMLSLTNPPGRLLPGQTALPFSSKLQTSSAPNTATNLWLPLCSAKARMPDRRKLTLQPSFQTFFRFGVKFVEELYSQQPPRNAPM